MGVLHGRDLFSSKYVTAEIKDATKRLWYVPIKHTIGDFFLTVLDGQLYCFKIDGEVCQYRETFTRSFSVIQYDIKHYRPIKSEIKELELALQVNSLPKLDITLSNVVKILASREKVNDFQPHDLKEYVDALEKYDKSKIAKIVPQAQSKYAELTKNMINYLKNLDIDQVVTPMRGISDFIEGDLKARDPHFMGTVATTMQTLDFEDKKLTNAPITAKKGWMKMILIMLGIMVVGLVLYMAYNSGAFDFITKPVESFSAVGDFFKTQGGANRPPSAVSSLPPECQGAPEACKQAVDLGQVKITELPESMRKVIESMPSITPKEHEVKIGS